jgi:alpha-D-ribose 1-methylphosphonate 5-triphosphate synthase subunit PhnI
VTVDIALRERRFSLEIREIAVTECQVMNSFAGSRTEKPQVTRGYGLALATASAWP